MMLDPAVCQQVFGAMLRNAQAFERLLGEDRDVFLDTPDATRLAETLARIAALTRQQSAQLELLHLEDRRDRRQRADRRTGSDRRWRT